MLTIHRADAVLGRPGLDAVLVKGGLIVAIGSAEGLTVTHFRARVRRWPGLLTPGLREPGAVALLEAAYHPDPREADELGTDPLTGDALTALAMDDTRWGHSTRRGIQRLLARGNTALTGPFTRPAVRTAVTRSGLRVRQPDTEGASSVPSVPAAKVVYDGGLEIGGPADFAVFSVPGRKLDPADTHRCVATVLGGRLLYRRA
ncbi:hypothetical protein [Streptomyces albipurpureus]|uniref:Amidohydrolase n=1 Tax=Streptomyces albipurpureus TaxID=2897419 RepID=A0ABT0UZH7_9ACTN|nr:hypothetical protein [Streptomyces sp. CWNU-1]MCM2393978.1 hypothetical protein [Streptomyces sp. CWNU-1]